MDKKITYGLLSIFIVVLVIRLYFAFTIPNLTYDSYFHLRQVENIVDTGLPLFNDPLSYGGREIRFLPFFHYLMALFNLLLPLTLVAKIIPNLLIASLTLIIFFISNKISNNPTASLFSAGIAGFLPILFNTNSFTVATLFLPLMFLTIYAFLNVEQPKYVYMYLLFFLLLCLTSPITFLLLVGFGIYLLLSLVEGIKIKEREVEIIIFSLFFYAWVQLLFFKNTLLAQGIGFIWQNVPSTTIQQYFPNISLAYAIILISILPFLAGIIVIYNSLFKSKDEQALVLIGLVISTSILALLKLVQSALVLPFFALILAILFSLFYRDLFNYINQTKFSFQKIYPFILAILLAVTLILPAATTALDQKTPSNDEVNAFIWLKDNTPKNAGVLGLLEEGNLITYYGHRKNLMDDQFILIKDVDERFVALNTLFTTSFETYALSILGQYNINYLVLTPSAKEKYSIQSFKYTSGACLKKVYSNFLDKDLSLEGPVTIFELKCTLERSGQESQ